MNRDTKQVPLPIRAYRYYRNRGLRSVAETGGSLFSKQVATRYPITSTELEHLGKMEGQIWYAAPEDGIRFHSPDSPQLQNAFRQYPTVYRPRTGFVCELEDCVFLNRYATGLYKGRRIILETTRNQRSSHYIGDHSEITKQTLLKGLSMPEPTHDASLFPLVFPMFSYYHWMVEYLPKLRLLELYSRETGETPTVLIDTDAQKYVSETLELAGYPTVDCLRWDGTITVPQKAIIPVHREHKFDYENPAQSSYHPSREDLQWVRNRMRSAVSPDMKRADRRIYISRQDAERGRKVTNYDEVMAELESRGFDSYQLEHIPFEKQVKLFSEAEVVMGVHGAGLTNMIFSDDPLVFELFPQSVIKPHFYFLSRMMEFEYESLVTDACETKLDVNIHTFRERLDRVGL